MGYLSVIALKREISPNRAYLPGNLYGRLVNLPIIANIEYSPKSIFQEQLETVAPK
jgi:hypothetical protein